MKNIKFFSAFLIIAAAAFFWGCGDSSTPTTPGPGGTAPTIDMKKGSVFTFTYDTLNRNTSDTTPVRLTNMTSTDTYTDTTRVGSNLIFTIRSSTDSAGIISIDTTLVYYDAPSGKFYQYGLTRLINPLISPTWDLVADFSLSTGTTWNLPLNPNTISISGFAITINLNAKVAEQTSFLTTSNPSRTINCYRIEFKADLTTSNIAIGSILFDYFLGYNDGITNSSGIVRLKLRPVNIGLPTVPIFSNFGLDRKTNTFSIP